MQQFFIETFSSIIQFSGSVLTSPNARMHSHTRTHTNIHLYIPSYVI